MHFSRVSGPNSPSLSPCPPAKITFRGVLHRIPLLQHLHYRDPRSNHRVPYLRHRRMRYQHLSVQLSMLLQPQLQSAHEHDIFRTLQSYTGHRPREEQRPRVFGLAPWVPGDVIDTRHAIIFSGDKFKSAYQLNEVGPPSPDAN